MAGTEDAADLKSAGGNPVRVQLSPPAPITMSEKSIREQCWEYVTDWAKESCREEDEAFITRVGELIDTGNLHEHTFGPVEKALFTGNPHRKCTHPGCKVLSLDLDDE